MCLRRSILVLGVKIPSPLDSPFNSFRWARFSLFLYLCFTWDMTKWCKIYTKTDSWFQKSHEEFGQLQTSSEKSKKLKFDEPLLFENTFCQLKDCTEDLFNITFNYLCENSPNFSSHFWSHKSFFTTQLFCLFLAQSLHTFYKSSPSKCKFWDFLLLTLKFTKLLLSFFKHFGSLFSIMKGNFSVLF